LSAGARPLKSRASWRTASANKSAAILAIGGLTAQAQTLLIVMAVLVPAIHVLDEREDEDVDARDRRAKRCRSSNGYAWHDGFV
jgi:hypothetical protein